MKRDISEKLFQRAQRYIPGGVDSPVRAYKAVGGTPPFIVRGKGSRIHDADGNEFLDMVGSWGPLILGHACPPVVAAIREAALGGTSFGAPTAAEVELAEVIAGAVPSVELVRFVSSGTEACMSALRVARAFTGRSRIVKFAGGYHGHSDGLLVQAGSGGATLGIPSSAGVPQEYAALTLVARYNDVSSVEALFRAFPGEIAAVILEPVAGNVGVVPPAPGFLRGLREQTSREGALLIFDEVITGFRVGWGGAQGLYGVRPDLTCLGKVIGGGLPVGAFGGRREAMEMVAPLGPVYQAGTLSGNPLAMAAGIATLKELKKPGAYERLEGLSAALEEGLRESLRRAGAPASVNRVGSMVTLFFSEGPVNSAEAAMASDAQRYGRFFQAMLEQGVYLPPSQFEAWFVSLAHTERDVEDVVRASERALAALA